MRELICLMMLIATLGQANLLKRSYAHQKDIVSTRESLRRLASLTMEMFQSQDPPQGTAFWRALGRDTPIYDLWGQEFKMEIYAGESQKVFLWLSAGPDQIYGSGDDIKVRVPYQKGATLDLTHPEISGETGLFSIDAK